MCAKPIENLGETLRREGYRFTRQRQIILEELRQSESHLSAKELYDAVKARLPNVSLGTVYRGLDVLADLGLIRRLDYGEHSRFEANLSNHYHLICIRCGRIFDVAPSTLERLNTQALEAKGFEVHGHRFELYGRCPECRNL
jgi:Fur family peroxide stress response transcriptional regulator